MCVSVCVPILKEQLGTFFENSKSFVKNYTWELQHCNYTKYPS